MLDREESLRLLEMERAKQIELIRNMENNMRELWNKEQSQRRQLCQAEVQQVEIQEEILLNEVVKHLTILDQMDNTIEALRADNVIAKTSVHPLQ